MRSLVYIFSLFLMFTHSVQAMSVKVQFISDQSDVCDIEHKGDLNKVLIEGDFFYDSKIVTLAALNNVLDSTGMSKIELKNCQLVKEEYTKGLWKAISFLPLQSPFYHYELEINSFGDIDQSCMKDYTSIGQELVLDWNSDVIEVSEPAYETTYYGQRRLTQTNDLLLSLGYRVLDVNKRDMSGRYSGIYLDRIVIGIDKCLLESNEREM